MTRKWIPAVLGLLMVPLMIRTLWFYRGAYRPDEPVRLPGFSDIRPPQPPIGEFPRALPQAEPDADPKTVLIDTAHENRFAMSELDSLTKLLAARGARIEILDSSAEFDQLGLEGRLKFADAFLVVAPFEGFSREEVSIVSRFVERGGRLLVILDPTRTSQGADIFGFIIISASDDIVAANRLLAPHDLSFSDDYLYDLLDNEGNYRNVFFREFADGSLTAGLDTVALYAARSVTTVSGTPLLLAGETTLSSATDAGGALAAAALSPSAGALAVGDLTFMTPPYNTVADNRILIQNLAEFLLAGERQPNLNDLPFVFSGPVSVLQSGDFAVRAETLLALDAMGDYLQLAGINLNYDEDLSDEADRLVLGLFDPDDTIEGLMDGFDLVLPTEDPDGDLVVPGFGSVNSSGLGFIGLQAAEGRTTLVLLAEDQESLVSLLETIGSGLLSDCLLQGDYGLCQVGEGTGFESQDDFELDLNFEETIFD